MMSVIAAATIRRLVVDIGSVTPSYARAASGMRPGRPVPYPLGDNR